MSLQLWKPVCGGPGWISPIKHCTQACAFATFSHFPQARICAPFFHWFKAHTYKGLRTKHFLGLNNAWKCPHACPFIPWASHSAYQNTCLSNTCVLFVLLTSNVPRSFYSAEYEILTVFWQQYQTTGVIPFLGHDTFCWNCPTGCIHLRLISHDVTWYRPKTKSYLLLQECLNKHSGATNLFQ